MSIEAEPRTAPSRLPFLAAAGASVVLFVVSAFGGMLLINDRPIVVWVVFFPILVVAAVLGFLALLMDEQSEVPRGFAADGIHSAGQPSASDQAAVGSWWPAVVFFGWIGGLVGYASLRDTQPRRASHVAKWGLIWTGIWIAVLAVFNLVIYGIASSSLG